MLGLIVACEWIYFTAFFVAILFHSETGTFTLWGAVAALAIALTMRRIAPRLKSSFPFSAWLLPSACYLSFGLSGFWLGLQSGAASLLLWPLGISCALVIDMQSIYRIK